MYSYITVYLCNISYFITASALICNVNVDLEAKILNFNHCDWSSQYVTTNPLLSTYIKQFAAVYV